MFEDLVRGLIILHEKGFITKSLVDNLVTQYLINEYKVAKQKEEEEEE